MNRANLKSVLPCLAAALICAAGPARAAGPNLVIIGWDTLRADHVGALGYKRPVTPSLDALAAESLLFTNAVSQAPWTLPSFMSVFTGLYPSEHGVANKFVPPAGGSEDLAEAALSTGVLTLPELLKRAGYRTAAFTGGAGLKGSFGFSRGFDVYVDSADFGGFADSFKGALAWLQRNKDAPYFVFIHGYDTHPYRALDPAGAFAFVRRGDRERALNLRTRHDELRARQLEGRRPAHTAADERLWKDAYDEKVLRADRLLGGFLEKFDALGSTGTVLVLLSDHGEELFDHGGVDHGMSLYDEVLRVPLLVRAPGRKPARVTRQVRLIDVFPTVAELLGLELGEGERARLRGESLLAQAAGTGKELDAYSETSFLYHFSKRSLRKSSGLKLIADQLSMQLELYDTAADPREKRGLFEKAPARAYPLELDLLGWEEGLAPAR